MIHFHKVRQASAEMNGFSLMVGPENLLLGTDGGLSGGANLFP